MVTGESSSSQHSGRRRQHEWRTDRFRTPLLLQLLLGRLRMSGHSVREPDGSETIIDAVPEPTAARYLVLPLFELLTIHDTFAELTAKRMLPAVPLPRIGGEPVPCDACVCGRNQAKRFPAVDRIARGVAELPAGRSGRRCYSLAAFRHRSAFGAQGAGMAEPDASICRRSRFAKTGSA